MEEHEVEQTIEDLKLKAEERPYEDNVNILELEEGQEIDVLDNGVLYTYIKRGGMVHRIAWTKVL